MSHFTYKFIWDPAKAVSNYSKHDVAFVTAMSVFEDPVALSRYDLAHSEVEERWVTGGKALGGDVLVVVHTITEQTSTAAEIRIISARNAPRIERQQYENSLNNYMVQEPMEAEYDFTDAKRGRFYRKDAVLEPPVHIDPKLLQRLIEEARARNMSPSDLINEVLSRALGGA